jgi:hypothetical protein
MVQDPLPPRMRRKLHRQTFHVEPTKLNLAACSSMDYPQIPWTEMLEHALACVARIHHTDDDLRAWTALPRIPLPPMAYLHHPPLSDRSSYPLMIM